MLQRFPRVWVVSFCTLTMIGCSGSDLAPVKGKVSYNGEPVPSATVTFMPTEGKMSIGTTGADGTYELNVAGGGVDSQGAKIGSHAVSISAVETVSKQVTPDAEKLGSIAEMSTITKSRSLIPPKYASSRTSGLTFEVKSGVENEANFELTD